MAEDLEEAVSPALDLACEAGLLRVCFSGFALLSGFASQGLLLRVGMSDLPIQGCKNLVSIALTRIYYVGSLILVTNNFDAKYLLTRCEIPVGVAKRTCATAVRYSLTRV